MAEAQECMKDGIGSMAERFVSMSEDMKEVLLNQEEVKTGLAEMVDKVDELQHLTLDIGGKLSIPRVVLMLPDTGKKTELSKEEKEQKKKVKKPLKRRFKSKATKTMKKARIKLGVNTYYKLLLCCEGGSDGTPCSGVHAGYSITAPGPTLQKMAPLLIITSKMLSIASVAGKCAGLPIPSCIPGFAAAGGLSAGFAALIDSPLTGATASVFAAQYGEKLRAKREEDGEGEITADDEAADPSVGDLLDMLSEDLSFAAKTGDSSSTDDDEKLVGDSAAKAESKRMVGDAYKAVEEMLNTKTKWKEEKADFYIQRYKVSGQIKWLCSVHAEVNMFT